MVQMAALDASVVKSCIDFLGLVAMFLGKVEQDLPVQRAFLPEPFKSRVDVQSFDGFGKPNPGVCCRWEGGAYRARGVALRQPLRQDAIQRTHVDRLGDVVVHSRRQH